MDSCRFGCLVVAVLKGLGGKMTKSKVREATMRRCGPDMVLCLGLLLTPENYDDLEAGKVSVEKTAFEVRTIIRQATYF